LIRVPVAGGEPSPLTTLDPSRQEHAHSGPGALTFLAGATADLPPYGAGEASLKPMLATIANAIHDATGVRIRRVPFRDDRVLAVLKAARV
jgi:hypothetical protein